MSLSEREQKLLEQMERALYAEDPQFASTLRDGRRTAKTTAIGVVLILAGIGLLVFGLSSATPLLGVVGFAGIVGGVAVALMRSGESPSPKGAAPAGGPVQAPRVRRSFMDMLSDRWDRRNPQ